MAMSQGLLVSEPFTEDELEALLSEPRGRLAHRHWSRAMDTIEALRGERDDLTRRLREWVCPECMGRVDVYDTMRLCRDSACGWREAT